MKKLLFVCSGNKLRSPTAEVVFRGEHALTRSIGTSRNAEKYANVNDLKWSDIIFVMEEKHKQRLLANFPRFLQYKDIRVLDIPDNYGFMNGDLVKLLKSKINIGEICN